MNSKRHLAKELQMAGAKQSETSALVEVAGKLSQLKSPSRAFKHRERVQAKGSRRYMASLSMAAVAGILVGAVLVAYAQTSLPGSWLYASKRLSEKVAVAVDPSYRATLMMRRSQEVRQLVGRHANEHVVLATLADYRDEAAAYKSANYAAFEFCKNNLKQAASNAPRPEQEAISTTLGSLQT